MASFNLSDKIHRYKVPTYKVTPKVYITLCVGFAFGNLILSKTLEKNANSSRFYFWGDFLVFFSRFSLCFRDQMQGKKICEEK